MVPITDTTPLAPANSKADLDAPLYGATFGQALSRFYSKYLTFSGRASRSEYWWVALFLTLIGIVLAVPALILGRIGAEDGQPGPGFIPFAVAYAIVMIGSVIPSISLGWRRLHDANYSGLLYLLNLIPYLGSLIVLILALLPSKPEGARYDKVPPVDIQPYNVQP